MKIVVSTAAKQIAECRLDLAGLDRLSPIILFYSKGVLSKITLNLVVASDRALKFL